MASQTLSRNGDDYRLSSGTVTPDGEFGASISAATGQASWVAYELSPGVGADNLHLAVEATGSGWLGVADFNAGTWDFTELNENTVMPVYLDASRNLSLAGNILLAVVAHDAGLVSVNRLYLVSGESLPVAHIHALQQNGLAPLRVNFSALRSYSPAGVVEYWFDFDGDGVFETDATGIGGYADQTYQLPGDYTPRLRIVDGDGMAAEDTVQIKVRDPADLNIDYDYVFDDSQVRRIDLAVTQQNWDAMWQVPDLKVMVEATATVFGEEVPSPIGLRMKGNLTLFASGEKKSWKLDFNYFDTDQTFHGLGALILNNNYSDPSQCREKLSYDLMRAAGVPGSRTCYVEVHIAIGEAEPEYWGLYTMVERIDKKYLRNRFEDNDGNLYEGVGKADLTWMGPTPADYNDGSTRYERVRGDGPNDWADLIHLLDVLNNTPVGDLHLELPEVLDAGSFLRFEALNKFLCSLDDYTVSNRNYFLYHETPTGQFKFLPWDFNMSFGGYGQDYENEENPLYGVARTMNPKPAPLFTRLMQNRVYRLEYTGYIDLIQRNVFVVEDVRNRAKHWHDQIAPCVELEDKVDHYDYSDFNVNWDQDVTIEISPGAFFTKYGIGHLAEIRDAYVTEHLPDSL